MSNEVATAYVGLLPSTAGFGPAVQTQVGAEAAIAGRRGGITMGKALIAGAAVGVAGAALLGKALYDAGATFDNVADQIRVGTGKTGDALDSLVQSAKNVGSEIPVAFDQIGPAITDINRRLDLTGPTLEKVTEQFLEAGRIAGQALDVKTFSSAFQIFDVHGKQTSKVLDELFRVSQSTGVGLNQLAAGVARNGPNLKQFGFSISESAGLIGTLDKAGLDSNKTLATLSRAMVQFAKDGREPKAALAETVGQIEEFTKKGNDAAAINLAGEIFGTRGASQFVAAIKTGKVNLDDLTAATAGHGDTILQAAHDTADFGEQWQLFKNNVLVAIEPLATKFFGAVGQGMAYLNEVGLPALSAFGAQLSALFSGEGGSGGALAGATAFASALATTLVPVLQTAATTFETDILPALVSLGTYLGTTLGPVFSEVGAVLVNQVLPILQSFGQFLYGDLYPAIVQIVSAVAVQLRPVFDQLVATFRSDVLPALQQLLTKWHEWQPTIQTVTVAIVKIIGKVAEFAAKILGVVLPALIRWQGFMIRNVVPAVIDAIEIIAKIIAKAIEFGGVIVDRVQDVARFVKGLKDKFGDAIDYANKVPGKILDALGDLGQKLYDYAIEAGRKLLRGLADGLADATGLSSITGAIGHVAGIITDHFPHSPVKTGPLTVFNDGRPGRVLMGMLAKGITDGGTDAAGAAEGVAGRIREHFDQLRDSLKSTLDGLLSDFASLRDGIAQTFAGDLFAATTAAAFQHGLFDKVADLRKILKAWHKLEGWGLDPKFLSALFQSGNSALILDLAAGTKGTALSDSDAFGQVQSLTNKLGTQVARNELGPDIKGIRNGIDKLNDKVDHLARDIGREINHAAANGHRRK